MSHTLTTLFAPPDSFLSRDREGAFLNFDTLIPEAAEEYLLPALYSRLMAHGIQPPPEIAEFLTTVEANNRDRNHRILDEARKIAALLNALGIEPVFLKGAAFLIEGIYPDPGHRYLADLDLLVPADRLEAAAAALLREGYRPDTRDAMARFRHHHPQLQKENGAPIELHHSLGHTVSNRILPAEDMLRDSRPLAWRGVRIRIPSPEHLVTHLILHSQLHHTYSERIWPPLRALVDLAHLTTRPLSWPSIYHRFETQRQASTLRLHLRQLEETFPSRDCEGAFPLPPLTPLETLRWRRRQILHRWPRLRSIDPIYLVLSTLSRRLRFLQSIASTPGGLSQAARMLIRPGFYRRLVAEISLR